LVDSEQLQQNLKTYQINHLEDVLSATQFKAGFNENIALITNIAVQTNAHLLGLGKSVEVKAIKEKNKEERRTAPKRVRKGSEVQTGAGQMEKFLEEAAAQKGTLVMVAPGHPLGSTAANGL